MDKRSDVRRVIKGVRLEGPKWKWHALWLWGNCQGDDQCASEVRPTTFEVEPRTVLGPRAIDAEDNSSHSQVRKNTIPPFMPAWQTFRMAGNEHLDWLVCSLQVVLQDISDRLIRLRMADEDNATSNSRAGPLA